VSPLVGHLLSDRYRLDAQIGTGGMSTVYRAFDTTLERTVAVKLMHREIASDDDQLERFRREARAVAQLSHPHIVNVIDAGEDDHRPFIVLEYVEGETLKDRIRRMGRLPVDEAIAYSIEIARALQCAHARGIVHRDIKPQNVLIDEEGSAKVTDFGIARTLEEDGLTADGRVLGTTDYVSPEQALGHAVNGQSDLYSLGVVLFEMLTGDVPFHGENQVAVAMKHVREEIPDIQVRRPEVTATLAAILDHLTAKDLGVRYPDAVSVVHDLEDALAIEASRTGRATGEATAVLKTLPSAARRRVPLRMRWHIPLAGIIVASLVVAGVLFLVLNEAADRAQRGQPAAREKAPTGTKVVRVKSASARDFDPQGDGREHQEALFRAVDTDKNTFWKTENYENGQFPSNKTGVGIYLDAVPDVDATSLVVRTPTRGWEAEIYVADGDDPPKQIEGWKKVAEGAVRDERKVFRLAGKERHRYYLVWITALPSEGQVQISEITLFQPEET
jgi:serine/threonine-protein kinase